jgi:hypothetical protein
VELGCFSERFGFRLEQSLRRRALLFRSSRCSSSGAFFRGSAFSSPPTVPLGLWHRIISLFGIYRRQQRELGFTRIVLSGMT